MSWLRTFPCFRHLLPVLLVLLTIGIAGPSLAIQQGNQGGNGGCSLPQDDSQVCTDHPFFEKNGNCNGSSAGNMLQQIIREIYQAIQEAAQKLYETITDDTGFQSIVTTCLVLYMTFFGVAFLFGFVQATLGQAVIRLIKIGLVTWVVSPGGWEDFSCYFVKFFNDGTVQLIEEFIKIAGGDTGGGGGGGGGAGQYGMGGGGSCGAGTTDVAAPFKIVDKAIDTIFSPKMLVTAVATFTTPPYGPLIGLALGYAILQFILAMLTALQVYALSLIAKALLFGIAPIFFPFMLFEQTKYLFQGWVNQLVNFSLQPILMFAFLAFFMTMIESSAKNILKADGQDVKVCWDKSGKQGSAPNSVMGWRFAPGGKAYGGDTGVHGCVEDCGTKRSFPGPSTVNILIFMILVYIGAQMMKIMTSLASELSNGLTKLDQVGGSMQEWLGGRRGGGGSESRDFINKLPSPKTNH